MTKRRSSRCVRPSVRPSLAGSSGQWGPLSFPLVLTAPQADCDQTPPLPPWCDCCRSGAVRYVPCLTSSNGSDASQRYCEPIISF